MQIFLLNSDTFKKSFLEGEGHLELRSDQNIWVTLLATGGKFLPTIDRVADVRFNLNNNRRFKFGKREGMKLSAGAEAIQQIQLIWPGENEPVLKAHGLEEFLSEGKLYVRLLLTAKSDAAAEGGFPVGPLSTNFGVGAGGGVAVERLKVYDEELTADKILKDLFAGLRLPQQVDRVQDIPEPGEVLITRFGGYLKLKTGMNWGYKLTGSQSIEYNQLKSNLDYAMRAIGALTVGYRFAGDFNIEARRGIKDGWARFVVRKNRDSQLNFAADFGFDGELDLKDWPRSADDFLTSLLGADAKTFLEYFHKSREYSSLEKLEKTVDPLVKGFLHDWSQKLIGKALSDQTLKEFLIAAGKISEAYGEIDSRILDLYHAYLDKIPQLRRTLSLLAGATNITGLIDAADEGDEDDDNLDSWEVIQLVWGTNVYPLLLQNEEFAKFSVFIKRAQAFVEEGAMKPVRDFIAKLKEAAPLDRFFAELGKIKTVDDLKQISDDRLKTLAGRLIGKAFDELKDSELNDALKSLQAGLNGIEDFKNNWYKKLVEAAGRKFTMDLHYAYARAARNERLLDVELDLKTTEGRRLARAAAAGDFAEILEKYNSRFVRVHRGVLTHELSESAHLRVNIMGWELSSLSQLVQKAEHSIESSSGGLLHVFTTKTAIEQRQKKGRKFKETIESNFLFRVIGETFQKDGDSSTAIDRRTKEYLIETLRALSVQYDLLQTDENTSAAELTRCLQLAEFLGLLKGRHRESFVNHLTTQFPAGLGKVKINYVVRYNEQDLREAFTAISSDRLYDLARVTMRELISSKYIGMNGARRDAALGFAYLSADLHRIFDKEGAMALHRVKSVILPPWLANGSQIRFNLSATDIERLITLCSIEKKYAERFKRLDEILDKALVRNEPISQKELQNVSLKFLGMADDLDDWLENAFFAIFDKVIDSATNGNNRRESAMVIELSAPGKEKVTKILTAQQ